MESAARMGPVQSSPALKKYGDILPGAIHSRHGQMSPRIPHLPDLRVKEPNFRAPTDIACSMSSDWYDWRDEEDIGLDGGGKVGEG